jgi:hypothetical protein
MTIPEFILGLGFALSTYGCLGASVKIVVTNAPTGVDSVKIAVDGQGFAAPLIVSAQTDTNGNANFVVTVPNHTPSRIRAVALQHHGTSIFPFIRAVQAAETNGTPSLSIVSLNFAAAPISITTGQMTDSGDGTVVVPVTFSSGGGFFFAGQVVNLWVSSTNSTLIADGTLFLAPLVQASPSAPLIGSFQIPASLAAGVFQAGYHALDFRSGGPEIPLLATAKYQLSEPPLQALSSEVIRDESSVVTTPSPVISGSPGTYKVVIGRDGRLIRVFTPAK